MMTDSISQRLAVDIGGTFTDVVLEQDGELMTSKVLTTPTAPEEGVLVGIEEVLAKSGVAPGDIGMFLHGTTLATNAIIERKGANVALITTDGFRDVLEIGYESRFNQYDIFIEKPTPLVPRHRRFTVPERVDVHGSVLLDLDEDAVKRYFPNWTEQVSRALQSASSTVTPTRGTNSGPEKLSRLLDQTCRSPCRLKSVLRFVNLSV